MSNLLRNDTDRTQRLARRHIKIVKKNNPPAVGIKFASSVRAVRWVRPSRIFADFPAALHARSNLISETFAPQTLNKFAWLRAENNHQFSYSAQSFLSLFAGLQPRYTIHSLKFQALVSIQAMFSHSQMYAPCT